jgi:UDP-N-acetylmuramoyl-L-alanyl-D-glutamate--2,6-diaminopimelate ligase
MAWHPPQRFLGELVARTPGAALVSGDPSTSISGVTHDTRRLEPGDLFVAIRGLEHDGQAFVPLALTRGAAAIAVEADAGIDALSSAVPVVRVDQARPALADLAAAFYGHPSERLPVVGITGTDGKTSTTQLLSAILAARGLRTGWLTTVSTRIGAELRSNATDNTTPEAPVVQRALAEMLAAGVEVAIVETSSHALQLDRVRATHFQVGVFTNLSPEHLNFHGTFEAYRAAKARLFEILPPTGLAVLNADDASADAMRAATRAPVVTYGIDRPADFMASSIRLSPGGTAFVVQPGGLEVRTRLVGRFNVSNWLAAYAAASHFGAGPEHLADAAASQAPVPGRMNLVQRGQPFTVVVDFAHTPQALGKALDTIRGLVSGRVLLAFGLAGGRDGANRGVMGALAARQADFFVITIDDPGHEDPAVIAAEIAAGARSAGAREGVDFSIDLDRRSAIRALFDRARPGDAVLLAGKGHEQRMVVADQRRPWNDATAAADVLAELGFQSQAVP